MIKLLFLLCFIGLILLLICFGLFACYLYIFAREQRKEVKLEKEYDNLIILGARVNSQAFQNRISNFQKIKYHNNLIFTGTKEECTAAQVYFDSNDIAVVYDELARNTWGNIENNVEYITAETVIISNDFHIYRIYKICQNFSVKPVLYSNDSKIYYKSYIREIFAIGKYYYLQMRKKC